MAYGNLHKLPKISDRLSYLYIEHARIDKEDQAIAINSDFGGTPVPCAGLALLMLGPGVSITHAAITTLAECGCLVAWVGEFGVRFYAAGTGTTRSANNIMKQAKYWTDERMHMKVVRMMYEMRFPDRLDPNLSLQQIRGKEGVRVRDTYARLSSQYCVKMEKREYDRQAWKNADPINKALSVANSCLYGICHAAIVAAGYSPALGFVHIGKQLSFVYDVADLYKMETTVPAAFKTVAAGEADLERRCRTACRYEFHQTNILKKIVSDIHKLFDQDLSEFDEVDDYAVDQSAPGYLWNPQGESSAGGIMYAGTDQEDKKW